MKYEPLAIRHFTHARQRPWRLNNLEIIKIGLLKAEQAKYYAGADDNAFNN